MSFFTALQTTSRSVSKYSGNEIKRFHCPLLSQHKFLLLKIFVSIYPWIRRFRIPMIYFHGISGCSFWKFFEVLETASHSISKRWTNARLRGLFSSKSDLDMPSVLPKISSAASRICLIRVISSPPPQFHVPFIFKVLYEHLHEHYNPILFFSVPSRISECFSNFILSC